MSNSCVICNEENSPLIKVKQKGIKTLVECSKKRNEPEILNTLEDANLNHKDIFVHTNCRKSFTDKRKLKVKTEMKETRTTSQDFHLEINCLFCSKECSNDSKNPSRKTWVQASTVILKKMIMKECTTRLKLNPNDEWAISVKSRIENCFDLVAARARYHPICRLFFQTQRSLFTSTKQSYIKGRRTNRKHMNSFLNACKWLENEPVVHSMKYF